MGKPSALLLIAAMTAVAPPAHAEDTGPIITIRFRFPGPICTGACANFEMRIDPNGQAVTRSLFVGGGTTRFTVDETSRYRFQNLMEILKRGGNRRLDAACADRDPDHLWDAKPDDLEMKWIDAEGTIRVTGCNSNNILKAALVGALDVLGIDPILGIKRDDDE
jgi:hypothetical protein